MVRPKAAECTVCREAAQSGPRSRQRAAYPAHPKGVLHLPSGKFQARLSTADGRRSASFATEAQAERWLHQAHADAEKAARRPRPAAAAPQLTFGEYAPRWLAARRVDGAPLAARTRTGYQALLDAELLPSFSGRPLEKITRDEVREWHAALIARNRPTLAARSYGLLRTIMGTAHDDELIAENPVRIRGASSTKTRHRVELLDGADLLPLVAALPERYRAMVVLAYWTGLRWGEITELRRGDLIARVESHTEPLPLEGAEPGAPVAVASWSTPTVVIRVRRAVVALPGGEFAVKEPKSRAGHRKVAVPGPALAWLRWHLAEFVASSAPDALLFPSATDTERHLRQSSFAKVFYPARDRIGRPDLRFHDLRHSSLTLFAQAGATLAEIKDRAGHSTTAAASRYQHTARGRDAALAERMAAL